VKYEINLHKQTKAVFLDRDGTINIDSGYICKAEDFQLFPFAAQAISILNSLGYLVLIVTNQSGITRGFYTFDDLDKIHNKMRSDLAVANAKIDDIFISPYHIEGKLPPYNIDHEDRKPGLGMFKKALKKYNFSVKDSFMIGDRYTDIVFGKKAGLKTILVLTGDGRKEFLENRRNWEYKPDFIVENLLVAAKFIKEMGNKL